MPRLLFVLNEAYFFLSHRLPVAERARAEGWEVHVAAPPDHVWAPPGFSVADLEAQGFIFHPIPLSRRGTNLFGEARTFLALWRLFVRLRPNLVHLVTIKPNLYGGLAARLARVPSVVFAVTGLGQVFVARGARAAMLRAVVRGLLRIALGHPNRRVIFQNHDDFRTWVDAGIVPPDAAMVVRGSGVDLAAYRAGPPPPGAPLVVLASRLIWEKGVQAFADAARLLRSEGVEARFALVGDTQPSNPRAVPAAILDAWQRDGVVEWWGYRGDMAAVLAESSIVCLPSTYGEGIPKILLEAAAAGRPIVTNDIAGCREAVEDGITGWLVPPGDGAALAARLRDLIENPGRAADFGAAGRDLAEREFSDDAIAAATVEVYRMLASRYNQRRSRPGQ
ncbi:MAG: glycosyltransferase family 4 protein [Proteobacteria bacterium]|nr:glycosyltransferase family 4 protein [Pseudomonadota bacterium]MDA1131881.1 glycosyltransferase family 4 protein [Pseudomonadota bacterium]